MARNLYVFSTFCSRFGNLGTGSSVLCGLLPVFPVESASNLLAYLPSTFTHILRSKCLASVRKTGENVRLCQLKSIFTWEACWHICVTSKCLSKLLRKNSTLISRLYLNTTSSSKLHSHFCSHVFLITSLSVFHCLLIYFSRIVSRDWKANKMKHG